MKVPNSANAVRSAQRACPRIYRVVAAELFSMEYVFSWQKHIRMPILSVGTLQENHVCDCAIESETYVSGNESTVLTWCTD
jgi:hypothetical protein